MIIKLIPMPYVLYRHEVTLSDCGFFSLASHDVFDCLQLPMTSSTYVKRDVKIDIF